MAKSFKIAFDILINDSIGTPLQSNLLLFIHSSVFE